MSVLIDVDGYEVPAIKVVPTVQRVRVFNVVTYSWASCCPPETTKLQDMAMTSQRLCNVATHFYARRTAEGTKYG